jgi:hypothetical protein
MTTPTFGLRMLVACAVLASSGCYKATFHQSSSAVRGAQHEEWTDYFLLGLVNHQTYDVRQLCGETPPAAVRTGGNFLTGLVSVLTIGIYTPRKLYVSCSSGGAK